ncbi:MAG: fibronectin type III domain-containing protein [Desulfatitalea sp.]|nr:fibronectin type III domain-containing protein [Desulfatitalea sp.]NNJ99818.1 fibronectin type III domain-containing protein [Desulfatitalea sp.]
MRTQVKPVHKKRSTFLIIASVIITLFSGCGESPMDTEAPGIPDNLSYTFSSESEIRLTWAPSIDDTATVGYRVFRNGTEITTVQTNSFADTGLSANTTYQYEITAYDAAGNESRRSAVLSVATLDIQAGICGEQNGNVKAAPFKFVVPANHPKFVLVASHGHNNDPSVQIMLNSAPENGVLYENGSALSAGSVISDTDALIYMPNSDYSGTDLFDYCAQGNSGVSNIASVTIDVVNSSAYPMPAGIPEPDFGIRETAPVLPANWNSDQNGFYYVKQGGSNGGNGSPTSPRSTIPSPIPAGSVVVIEGVYDVDHEINPITINGTVDNPVFIRGVDANNPGIITDKWVVNGSYYVIEYINGDWAADSYNGKIVLQNGDHGVVRHGDFKGDDLSCIGGVHIYPGSSEHVIFNNRIHHSGNWQDSGDPDCLGTRITADAHDIWYLDNLYAYNSGDAMQINAQGGGNSATHHIYVGRNTAHHNKQAGFWVKEAMDVIFSENTVFAHRPSDSSMGDGLGFQYGPEYVWFLFNHVFDTDSGIRMASDSGGTGMNHFVIGNILHDIHKIGSYTTSNSWEVAAIAIWGSTNTHIINNTIWDVDAGINSGRARGFINVVNNILDEPSISGANYLLFQYSDMVNRSIINNNLYLGSGTFRLGSMSNPMDLSQAQQLFDIDLQSIQAADAGFVDPLAADFSLTASSPAIDQGVVSDVYNHFYQRYGITINFDAKGLSRPQAQWDIGALEYINGP